MGLKESRIRNLQELRVSRGGAAFTSRKADVTPDPTIVIGLGGLGIRTFSTLKGKFIREIGESDHVYFLGIDSDAAEISYYCRADGEAGREASAEAVLKEQEMICLYDPDNAPADFLKPAKMPPYLKQWTNCMLIGGEYFRPCRQIGRIMLCNDRMYHAVRARLGAVVMSAIHQREPRGSVNIVLVTGVAGFTGGAIAIDLTYMIHDLFRSIGFSDYRISGYLFLPDVQFTLPGIQSSQTMLQNLKVNGYAALKEIDHFMDLRQTDGEYRLQLGSSEVVSDRDLFDQCTLVSGFTADGRLSDRNVIIGRLSDYLMERLKDIRRGWDEGVIQNTDFSEDSCPALLYSWLDQHTPRRLYHRNASYRYRILGYGSVVVPYKEMLAYCVNKIYAGVLQKFRDFTKVNRQMMQKVFAQTSVIDPNTFVQHAITINSNNPINRTLVMDGGYTRTMIKNDPFIAYTDACDLARAEKVKINGGFQAMVEDTLYRGLSQEVDKIFNTYGPYAALKAIEHRHTELAVGDPKEPFDGIIERLERLSEKLMARANAAYQEYNNGGKQQIQAEANKAMRRGLFGTNHAAVNSYVDICCTQAVTSQIDVVLYKVLSDAAYNVAVKMNKLNSELFEVYTSILTEIQKILNEDGQYFSEGHMEQAGMKKTFSVDIIKDGKGKATRLEKYLDSFISTVSVQELSQNFIKKMRDNRDKWVAQNSENDFDVVSEVRDLMDDCLTNNKMTTDIVEKFVTVAYSTKDMSPEELDAIWEDNTPNGPKIQALTAAAHEIYHLLINGAQTMAASEGVVPLSAFESHTLITVPQEMPQLGRILRNIVSSGRGEQPAVSSGRDGFSLIRQYVNVPMYILLGMRDCDQAYVDHPTAGRHMDENHQNWGLLPNPYTIDAAAGALAREGKTWELEKRGDYRSLRDVVCKTNFGLDCGYVEIRKDGDSGSRMILYDIAVERADRESLEEALYHAVIRCPGLEIVPFLRESGASVLPVEVNRGLTDIDLGLVDFSQVSPQERETIYRDIPVPIPDVFKWLGRSDRYMDILDRDEEWFRELWKIRDRALREVEEMHTYARDVEIFALALRAGLVKPEGGRPWIWTLTDGWDPVTVDLRRAGRFERKFYLYYVFVRFRELDEKLLLEYGERADQMIFDGPEEEGNVPTEHVAEMLSARELGDGRNREDINEEAERAGIAVNYQATDRMEEKGDPFLVLKRFYERLQYFLER